MRAVPLRLFICAAFACLVAPLALAPVANNDIWLHLKTGSLILERGQVPHADEYTFTRPAAPYIAHEWLAQVLFAAIYRDGGGLTALAILYAILVGALIWLIYRQTMRGAAPDPQIQDGWTRAAALLATVAAFSLMTTFLATRPHIFTFLMAAGFAIILSRLEWARPETPTGAVLALLLLQLLWANLHAGFIIGILLAAIHVAPAAWRHRRITRMVALPLALAAVSCVNPYGWRIYELVWRFLDPMFRRVIVEWESPFDSRFAATPVFMVYLLWLAAALAAAVWVAARERDIVPLVTALVFGAMSMASRRHISLLAIVTAPLVGRGLATAMRALSRRCSAAARAAGWASVAAAFVVLSFAGLIAYGLRSDHAVSLRPGLIARNIPVEAMEVMRAEEMRGRVFTTIGLGAYVTWRGWPELTTSIDSRLELFGGDFVAAHLIAQRDPDRFAELAARETFDFALLPWRLASVKGALAALGTDPKWALVYFDDEAELWARRTSEREALLGRRAFLTIDPVRYLAEGGFDANVDRVAAEREARRAVNDPPVMPGRPAVNTLALRMLRSLLLRR